MDAMTMDELRCEEMLASDAVRERVAANLFADAAAQVRRAARLVLLAQIARDAS